MASGRLRGWSCAVGIAFSNTVQGVAAAGLGAIVGVRPLFEAITCAGIANLAIEALRSAAAGRYLPFDHEKLVHQFGRGLAERIRIQYHQPQDRA